MRKDSFNAAPYHSAKPAYANRTDTAKYRGEIYVVTGVIFMGSNIQRIGGRVLIPTKIYKVIYDPSNSFSGAYIVDNGLSLVGMESIDKPL